MEPFIPLQNQPQFRCSACGECCSHIRGFIPESDRKFIEEFAFGKLPVVQLVPVSQMTFPLWDFEAKRFLEWGRDASIDPRIKPLRAIYDQNTNTKIILTYFMDSEGDACPMLKDRKCAIYHTKRAYVCRLFPFNKSPLAFSGSMDAGSMFGECGAMEKLLPAMPKERKEAIEFLKAAFPSGELENALQNDLVSEWANRTIIDLMKKKMVRPAMNYPYEALMGKMQNAKSMDFTDFLVECGHMSKEGMDALISRFDENADAKEWLSGNA